MAESINYPGKEYLDEVMSWSKDKLAGAQTTAGDIGTWISNNWSDANDSVNVVTYGVEFEKKLDVQVAAAFLDAQSKSDYATRVEERTEDGIKHDLRIAVIRNQLGARGQEIFDALMRNNTLDKLADKYAAETGAIGFRTEIDAHPDVVAFAIAKNAELGTGRLDEASYHMDAIGDVWDKSKTWHISDNPTFQKIFNWCKDIPIIGSITEFVRWAANIIDYVPQTINFVSKMYKQCFGGGDPDYQEALNQNRFEAAQERVRTSLEKDSGLPAGLAADIANIVRNPSSAADIKVTPPATPPAPAPAPDPEKGKNEDLVAGVTTGTAAGVIAGTLGADRLRNQREGGVTPAPNTQTASNETETPIRTPKRPQLGEASDNIEMINFDVNRTRAAKTWGVFVTQAVMAAPLTTYLGDLSAARDISSYNPGARFGDAKFMTANDAIAALDDENSPLFKKLIGEIDGRTLTAGSLSRAIFDKRRAADGNYTPQQAQDEAFGLMEAERRALLTNPADRDKPAQLSFLINYPEVDKSLPGYDQKGGKSPGMLIASELSSASQMSAYMTLGERISDERRAGILAFKEMAGSSPEKMADAIVHAMLDQNPLAARLDQLRNQGVNTNSLTAIPAVTQADLKAYLEWESRNTDKLEAAYDKMLGQPDVAQSRRYFAKSEVIGIQAILDNAIKDGKITREDMSPELLAFFRDRSVKSGDSPSDFSNVRILSADALSFVDNLYQDGPKGLSSVQTPKDIADNRKKIFRADAMILATAEQYNAFPGYENDHRESNINDILSLAKPQIANGSDSTAEMYDISLPNANAVGKSPIMVALRQREQNTVDMAEEVARQQALNAIAMDKHERERFNRELRAQQERVRREIEERKTGAGPMADASTYIGGKTTIAVNDVDAAMPVSPSTPIRSAREQSGPQVPDMA